MRKLKPEAAPKPLSVGMLKGNTMPSGIVANDAEGDEFCLFVTLVPGEDRAATRSDFYPRDHLRLPVAGGDV